MRTLSLPLLAALALAAPAFGQLPPDKAMTTFTVSTGLEWSLFAAEPLLVNPTSMDVDHKGRVWVCEAVNYRRKNFNRPILRPEGDRIVVLTDTDGDGKADDSTVFYQAPDLYGPLGIAVAKDAGPGYKVFVCQSPDILVFEDKDGDAKADGPPKKLLTNIGGFDHDHGVHGVMIGPDGKLYFTVGDAGVKGLQSADGEGRKWVSNGTDCRAGTVWRCDQDGTNLELIAHNFRNNYEPAVDSFGTVFCSDNDDDGNQQTRICYVMPGGNYGYHPRGPGQTHWHEEQPGVVHKILRTYFGSPCGMCVYEGALLPEAYRGHLLHVDAGPRHLRSYKLKANGAGYDVDSENVVSSTDNWFRPSDVCVGPDGSVFVCDWYDPGVGGHGMGDWTRGRVYRLTPAGHKGYKVPAVTLDKPEGVRAALASPCLAVRWMGLNQLAQMGISDGRKVTGEMLSGADPALRARGIQVAANGLACRGSQLAVQAARDEDGRVRATALRVLHENGRVRAVDFHSKKLVDPAVEPSPAVLRETLLLLRDADPVRATPLIYALAKRYDGKDRFYLSAINVAVGTDPKRREVILADFDKHFPEWNEKVASLVWELRPPSVLPRLEKLLADAGTPPAQRARVADVIAGGDGLDAGRLLLKVLPGAPAEVRDRVVENLKVSLPGKWRDLAKTTEFDAAVTALLADAPARAAGLAVVAASGRGEFAGRVRAVAADEAADPAVRKAAVQTLGKLGGKDALDALQNLAETGPLAADAILAVADHLPKGWQQPDKAPPALEFLAKLVKDGNRTADQRLAAVQALASNRNGTQWLLAAHEKKELPPQFVADAGRLLRGSPHQDLRNKALIAFPATAKLDLKKLPPPSALAARTGDAARGKALMAASLKGEAQCLKCHAVRGEGGQIGPDLSLIGKKASKENLFESILNPSKAVADQYVNWTVETTKGVVLNGLLVQETETTLTVRDSTGKDTQVPLKDVESRAKNPVSLMPADLAAHLTEQELVDLVEYLLTLKEAAWTPDAWAVAGPFPNGPDFRGLDEVYGPEKAGRVEPGAAFDGKAGKVRWRPVAANAEGFVDLKAAAGPHADDSVSYAAREVESAADQEATLLIGTDDGGKVWVNGVLAFHGRDHRASKPGDNAAKVKLRKGVNTVLVKVANGQGDHGFHLTVLSEGELKPVPLPAK